MEVRGGGPGWGLGLAPRGRGGLPVPGWRSSGGWAVAWGSRRQGLLPPAEGRPGARAGLHHAAPSLAHPHPLPPPWPHSGRHREVGSRCWVWAGHCGWSAQQEPNRGLGARRWLHTAMPRWAMWTACRVLGQGAFPAGLWLPSRLVRVGSDLPLEAFPVPEAVRPREGEGQS